MLLASADSLEDIVIYFLELLSLSLLRLLADRLNSIEEFQGGKKSPEAKMKLLRLHGVEDSLRRTWLSLRLLMGRSRINENRLSRGPKTRNL